MFFRALFHFLNLLLHTMLRDSAGNKVKASILQISCFYFGRVLKKQDILTQFLHQISSMFLFLHQIFIKN